MRPISRHLPPLQPAFSLRLDWPILTVVLVAFLIWAAFHPWGGALAGALFLLCCISTHQEERRLRKLAKERQDTICDFRKAFDVRRVDPYIIRATYQEIGSYLDPKHAFPLRATDNFERDLKIDGEDLDDLACDVAQRLNYDMSSCELNPLYGKVHTVRDFVMFFTHPPTGAK